MSDIIDVRFYRRTVAALSLLLPSQGGFISVADADLGYKMYGVKDSLGVTQSFLSKGQPIQTSRIQPVTDSTSSLKITKADGSTTVLSVDTTNGRLGIGTINPASGLDVNDGIKCLSLQVVTGAGVGKTLISDASGNLTFSYTSPTNVTGVLKGNGTTILAAVDGTDYLSPTTGITVSQSTSQTIGDNTHRLTKLWGTTLDSTSALIGATGTVTSGFSLDVRGELMTGAQSSGGQIFTNNSSINAEYNTNGYVPLALNFVGYHGGTTQFRDLVVYDGKQSLFANFMGAARSLSIGAPFPYGVLTLQSNDAISTSKQVAMNVGNETATSGTFTRSSSYWANRRADNGTITDDGVLILVDSESNVDTVGTGFVWVSGGFSYTVTQMNFSWDATGVQIFSGIGAVKNTDFDGNLCIYIYNGELRVKNRTGSKVNIGYVVDYFKNPAIPS